MSLYIDLQKRFISNFHKGIYPDMGTARLAFEAYWETLEVTARKVYKILQNKYGRGSGIVSISTVLDAIKFETNVSDECIMEVYQVMIMPKTEYHEYITEKQGGGIVL